jgi:hypothetical protein
VLCFVLDLCCYSSIFAKRRATGYTDLTTAKFQVTTRNFAAHRPLSADCVGIASDGVLGVAQ